MGCFWTLAHVSCSAPNIVALCALEGKGGGFTYSTRLDASGNLSRNLGTPR